MPEFRLESRTRDGKWLADLPFRDLQAEFFYNKPSTLRATLSTTALNQLTKEFIEPARTEVQLWRNNVCIFTGPLWDLFISSGEGTAKLVCESIESYFSKRYVKSAANRTGTYGNIMWSFVVDTQAQQFGNLFVTRGSTTGPGAPSGGPGDGPACSELPAIRLWGTVPEKASASGRQPNSRAPLAPVLCFALELLIIVRQPIVDAPSPSSRRQERHRPQGRDVSSDCIRAGGRMHHADRLPEGRFAVGGPL